MRSLERTTHLRASAWLPGPQAAVNELCLPPQYWRDRTGGIALRDRLAEVNCQPCIRADAELAAAERRVS